MIDSAGVVEIVPYRRKPFAVINTDSIVSISRWNRKGKIALGIATGAGIAYGAAAIASLSSAAVKGGLINTTLPILLLIPAVLDGYYILIATPIVFISEWASFRSVENGFRFYVE